jgi:hypothetical protein
MQEASGLMEIEGSGFTSIMSIISFGGSWYPVSAKRGATVISGINNTCVGDKNLRSII